MMLTQLTDQQSNNWQGFMIALICLAPIIMALLSFEFTMYFIQVKNTYFKKQKWFEKGLIVDIIVLVLTLIVAIIVTVFGYGQDNYIGNEAITAAGVALWWITIALSIAFILTRILLTNYVNKKYKLDPTILLNKPINEIAAFMHVENYKEIATKGNIKANHWKHLIDNDYNVLAESIKTIAGNVENYQVTKLIADCVIFHEQYVVSLFKKKRDYATALFLTLIELVRPLYNSVK